jgi:hypothetical protein
VSEPDDEDRADALEAIRESTQRRAVAEEAFGAAVEAQTTAIRTAIAAGVSTLDLAAETGLSRARIYQIRDGRR